MRLNCVSCLKPADLIVIIYDGQRVLSGRLVGSSRNRSNDDRGWQRSDPHLGARAVQDAVLLEVGIDTDDRAGLAFDSDGRVPMTIDSHGVKTDGHESSLGDSNCVLEGANALDFDFDFVAVGKRANPFGRAGGDHVARF